MEKFWKFILWILIVRHPNLINGYLNVFLGHEEVVKIMGLEVDLFYVHEGAINNFAIQFRVPFPTDQYDVEFSWQSLTSYPLPYHLYVEYEIEKQEALSAPQLSIAAKGYVPQTTKTFTIHFPCTGKVSLQVPFTIHLYVWGPPRTNDTKLDLKRQIICQKGHYSKTNQFLVPSLAPTPSQNPELLGGAACAVGLVMVVGLIASAMYVRTKKRMRQDSLQTSLTSTADCESHQNVFIRLNSLGRPPSANSGSYATIASLNKYPLSDSKKSWFRNSSAVPSPYATSLLPMDDQIAETIYTKPDSVYNSKVLYYASSQITQMLSTPKTERTGIYDAKDKLRRLPNLQPGALNCNKLIKKGLYGRLYNGKLGESCDVLIKTVIEGASLIQVSYLLSEASVLIGVSHPNILAPMVANTELPGTPEIAYPHPVKGNLKIFLQNSREGNTPLGTRLLVQFGLQITKGLAHLHSLGIIHKDIATRNCYLDSESYVKICDNALSKDLFPDDYHCLGANENFPIKWMALEMFEKNYYYYLASGDIWSLGVLFWELATLAATPFVEVDPLELEPYLKDGYRLGQPINCPNEFYTVMSCCWNADPNQRPSNSQLIAYLVDFHDDLKKYI